MRIVLVTSRFPLPAWRGNQVRTCQWIDALDDHDVCIVCPEPDNDDFGSLRGQCQAYKLSGMARLSGLSQAFLLGLPFQEGLYRVGAGRRTLRAVLEEHPCDLLIVQMLRCGWAAEVLERVAPDIPWIFDAIDSMGLHFSRSAGNFHALWRPLVKVEAWRCRRRERDLALRASLVTAVARRDLDAIAVGRLRLVPVSGKAFDVVTARDSQPTILLSGNLGYRPTVAAAMFFAVSVWPRIREQFPDLRWVLAGARPASTIIKLARDPRIEVHGDVDDLAPFLERATLAIAPMATGSGVPMKVLEAWAAGVPVITHPQAAAGLESGDHGGVAVAETAEEWVATIVELLSDSGVREDLALKGSAIWSETYSPGQVRQSIRDAVFLAQARVPSQ